MVATTQKNIGALKPEAPEQEALDPAERQTISRIKSQVSEHVRVTFYELGAASASETSELEKWANNLENDPEAIKHSDSFIQWSRSAMRSAMGLYSDLKIPLASAVSRKLISQKSYDNWLRRFRNSGVSYKQKEYWVENQLPHYIASWEKVCNERKTLLANPALKLLEKHHDVRLLQNESAFLDMHYDRRVDLLAKVRAALIVDRKDKGNGTFKQLHEKATGILYAAVAEGAMSGTKVGTWLERIFKKPVQADVIARFLGGGSGSLQALITKWRDVRAKYDDVCRKGAPLKNPAIGLYMISPERFLNMHYAQRKSWVDEASHRINEALKLEEEPPEFIRIRHALDLKDWDDADALIKSVEGKNAVGDIRLTPQNQARLRSMKNYLLQMRSSKKDAKDKEGKPKDKSVLGKNICSRISDIVSTGIPSSMQPTVMRLLRSSNPNRGIHQLRWIVYNNKWCRDHNFLDYERAKKGASKESSELTNWRARNHIDTKRRQDHVMNEQNSGQQFMRQGEHAKRRATLMHVDMQGSATTHLAVWLEKPQDPMELYWRTFCGHEGGIPKSEAWHNELFNNLTTLRSLTLELEKSGFLYGGVGLPPVSRN